MNPAQLLSHFDRLTESPNAIPCLRRFILDLAVRGKLVEQDPRDEPGSELLKCIQTEKARLVKEGKIGNQEPFEAIEESEIPFHIPKTWEWVSATFPAYLISDMGKKVQTKDVLESGEFPVVDQGKVFIRGYCNDRDRVIHIDAPIILFGDHTRETKLINFDFVVGADGVKLLHPVCILTDYYYLALKWLPLNSRGYGRHFKLLRAAFLPLPPFAEQHRIVAKVDELMALYDRLEAAQAERESRRDRLVDSSLNLLNNEADADAFRDHARFYFNHLPRLTTRPEHIQQLRQRILNLAVRGKLVPQDPHDEPASELLKRIQAEKTKLVKEGKRKKDVELDQVDDTQTPFTLPPSWVWARFPELGIFGRGKSKHRPRNDRTLFDGGTHLLIQTGDVARSKGVIETHTSKYNDIGLAQSMKRPKGTLCITIAANIADSGILSFDACFPDSVVGFIPVSEFPSAKYFEYFIRTAKADLLAFAPATAQKNINLEILNAVLIPLPPLAEQQRIVAKVDELMALCDRLEAQLTTTQTEISRLLEAVLHDALAGPSELEQGVLR